MIRPGLFIAYGVRGRGVFTSTAIEAGEVVEVCPALDLPDVTIYGLADYVYYIGLEDASRLLLGYGSLYSHSDQPNCSVEHGASASIIRATRNIEPLEELTHDYGPDWWAGREEKKVG